MPTIHFFTTAELPAHFSWQIRSFMRMHWPFLFGGEGRLRPDLWWLETLAPVHVVLAEKEVLIGYTAVVQKTVVHADQTFTSLGLHGVFTFPDFRHEGYGAQLVAAATDYIQHQPTADIAILFCPPELRPFYGAAGWQYHPEAVTLIGPAENPSQIEIDPEMPDLRMMLFLTDKGQAAEHLFWQRPFYFGGVGW